jgi:molybdopterin-guanine dinucleotide biosynthesis protein A
MNTNYTAVILAGGQSSRMNKNKALCKLGNKMLIEYSIELFKKRGYEILISGKKQEYAFLNYPVFEDNFQNIGPIAGIEATLKEAQNSKVIYTSCDTPFLSNEVLNQFEKYAPDFDIIVPLVNGYMQPLTSLYSKNLHSEILKLIQAGLPYPKDLIKQSVTKQIEIKNSVYFYNINTITDLDKAEEMIKKQFLQ